MPKGIIYKKFIIFICCAALTVISLTVPVSAADYTADVKLYSTVDLLINTDSNAVPFISSVISEDINALVQTALTK